MKFSFCLLITIVFESLGYVLQVNKYAICIYLSIYLYISIKQKNSSKKYILLRLNRKTKNLNKQKGSMQIAIFTNDFRLRLTRYKKKRKEKNYLELSSLIRTRIWETGWRSFLLLNSKTVLSSVSLMNEQIYSTL